MAYQLLLFYFLNYYLTKAHYKAECDQCVSYGNKYCPLNDLHRPLKIDRSAEMLGFVFLIKGTDVASVNAFSSVSMFFLIHSSNAYTCGSCLMTAIALDAVL